MVMHGDIGLSSAASHLASRCCGTASNTYEVTGITKILESDAAKYEVRSRQPRSGLCTFIV